MKGIILTALLVFFNVNAAQAACDTKSLKGSYAVALTGLSNGISCGYIGLANFNGKGTMTMNGIIHCGAPSADGNGTFSYNLDANCLGTATGNTGNDHNFVFNKTLTTGNIMLSAPKFVLFGTITKQ
jgi:hypothetical protein